jgi:hypothetical protein
MSELCPRWPAEATYRWLAADRLIARDSDNEEEENKEEEEEQEPDEEQDDEGEDTEGEYDGYSE